MPLKGSNTKQNHDEMNECPCNDLLSLLSMFLLLIECVLNLFLDFVGTRMRKPKNAVKSQPRTVLCSTLFSPVFSMYGQANGAEEVSLNWQQKSARRTEFTIEMDIVVLADARLI